MSKIAFFSNIFCIFSNVLFWPTNAKNIKFRSFNSTQSGPARLYTSYSPQRPRQRPPHSGTFRFFQKIFKKIVFFKKNQRSQIDPKRPKTCFWGAFKPPKAPQHLETRLKDHHIFYVDHQTISVCLLANKCLSEGFQSFWAWTPPPQKPSPKKK